MYLKLYVGLMLIWKKKSLVKLYFLRRFVEMFLQYQISFCKLLVEARSLFFNLYVGILLT